MKLYRKEPHQIEGSFRYVEVVVEEIPWCAEHNKPYAWVDSETGEPTTCEFHFIGECRLERPGRHLKIKEDE